MPQSRTADFVVIGLGAVGSATAWQLARRGAKVIGIDRFSPPHTQGSSHGESRITRLAVGEGAVYVPLVRRSHEIWAELEARAAGRSPGVLRPEACVAAQVEEARRAGADIRCNEQVLAIDAASVRTTRGSYSAQQVIVTAGAWLPGLVGGAYASQLKVMRQVLLWFRATEPALFAPSRCPTFIWTHGAGDDDQMYGFPLLGAGDAVKVATEQFRETTDPDRVNRQVCAAEWRAMFDEHIAGRLRGLSAQCVRTATCLYTVSPDGGFVVDRHPRLQHVTVVSPCSGHGFKHSAALGEQLALRALGEPAPLPDWGGFAIARFA